MEYKYPPLPERPSLFTTTWIDWRNSHEQYAAQAVAPLLAEIERLRRGEFICGKCGLRKNSEHTHEADF